MDHDGPYEGEHPRNQHEGFVILVDFLSDFLHNSEVFFVSISPSPYALLHILEKNSSLLTRKIFGAKQSLSK